MPTKQSCKAKERKRRMTRFCQIALIVLLAAAVLIGGCAKSGTSPNETPPSVSQETKTPPAQKPEPPAEREAAKPPVETPTAKPAVETAKTPPPAEKEPVKKPETKRPAKPETPVAKPKGLPKLIDLGAEKCIPCKMMVPVLAELKSEYKGKLDVVVIDTGKDPDATKKYRVVGIPTQIFYDAHGEEVARHMGFISKDDILDTFRQHGIDL